MSIDQGGKAASKKVSGFSIIEIMIVLAISGVILSMIFLSLPALKRNERNSERKNDVSLIQTELINYHNATGGVPGPYTGGVCFEYSSIPAPGFCAQSVMDYFTGLTTELSYYKNINQFFYATDYGITFSGWCTRNPLTCSGGNRNLSNVVPSPDGIFIDSSSVCVGNDQETWTTDFKNEIIAYALENSDNGVNYRCINVFD